MIKPVAKSWIIIICTLIIGIAIGFEISEIFIRHRFEELRDIRATEGFIRIFRRTLNLNEKQEPLVDSILVKYHNRIDAVSKSNKSVVTGIIDSMKNELKTKLSPEQIKRLDEVIWRLTRPVPSPSFDRQRNRRLPGPPGGSMPPDKRLGPPPGQRMPGEKMGLPPDKGFQKQSGQDKR